ncbi:hypothetical protein J6590_060659 [Homalodisca vitripennis]|nr:hypothetical protein J6590_060659 [Homalodisca vitripennis]
MCTNNKNNNLSDICGISKVLETKSDEGNDDEDSEFINKTTRETLETLNLVVDTLNKDLIAANEEIKQLKIHNNNLEMLVLQKEEEIMNLLNKNTSSFSYSQSPTCLPEKMKKKTLIKTKKLKTFTLPLRNSFQVLEGRIDDPEEVCSVIGTLPLNSSRSKNKTKITPTRKTQQSNPAKEKITKRKILLAADSHGRDLAPILEAKLGSGYEVTVVSSSGAPFNYVANNLQDLTRSFTFNDHAILLAGTNDITDSTSASVVNFNTFSNITLNTNMSIIGIPHRLDQPALNESIRKVNVKIEEAASNVKLCNFIDMSSLHLTHYTKFGLHLNKSGKHFLAELIHQSLKVKKPTIVQKDIHTPGQTCSKSKAPSPENNSTFLINKPLTLHVATNDPSADIILHNIHASTPNENSAKCINKPKNIQRKKILTVT